MVTVTAARTSMNLASGLLSGKAHFLHWGVVQISLTNFVIIVAMLVVFALALVLPFPGPKTEDEEPSYDRR